MTQTPSSLSYDIVIATRNRPEAVALSLPLILRQTRLPAQVVIVDSSQDGTPIENLARKAASTAAVPVRYMRAEAGLTHQRNIGLAECSADVVIFPDDDSLFYLDAAAEIMAVYEADTDGWLAGVAGAPVDRAPPETEGDLGSYSAEKTGSARSALRSVRQAIKEVTGAANPFVSVGRRLSAQYRAPAWLSGRGAVIVPYMTGFRMSFRREVIATTGFDETLRKYGWFEDVDASWSALRQGLVVTATRARVYHHRVTAARDNGHRMGLWAVLNRTYVVMKHVHANPQVFPAPAREAARLKLYCRARAMAYRALARDAFARERAAGAADGLGLIDQLAGAEADRLSETYKQLEQD